MIGQCPNCGAKLTFCLNAYMHFVVVTGQEGRVSLQREANGDHDEDRGKLSCKACDWEQDDVEVGDTPFSDETQEGRSRR